MKRFTKLFYKLDSTTKTNTKLEALVEYFSSKKVNDKEKIWALYILSGNKVKAPATRTQLKGWAADTADVPLWLFEESYAIVGDMSETISLIIQTNQVKQEESLEYWIDYLIQTRDLGIEEKKKRIQDAWLSLDTKQRFIFNKLMSGAFRVGASKQTVINALAKVSKVESSVISHRLTGNWHPSSISFKELVLEESKADQYSKPYPFCLAYTLEASLEELGKADAYSAEWKWDGIRAQAIFRNDELFLWSRGEEIITDQFPEFRTLIGKISNGTVLDAEIVVVINNKIQSFNSLQYRLGRKNVTEQMILDYPAKLIVYDILENKGKDTRNLTFLERRKLLKKLIKNLDSNLIQLSKKLSFGTWDELRELHKESRKNNAEGFMLKPKESIYETGRKKNSWVKWKVDPFSIDAVMIYAQRGSGRRANLYTDYTFAVKVKQDSEELVPFAKAYSGLTDEEIRKVNSWINKNTVEKFGPVRSVKPELIFEIGFEGIQRSKRHKSGIAVRFPRILRQRIDKTFEDIDTLQSLEMILKEYEGRG